MSREQDQAFIKTFIGVIGFLVALTIFLIVVASLTVGGDDEEYAKLRMERTSERLEPVGQVRVSGEPMPEIAQPEEEEPAEPRSGEEVTQAVCAACHANDFQNAPQIGDEQGWSERAQKGLDTLVSHSVDGFGNMPAQGGSASEEEIREAILYMAEESGVSLGE